VVRPRPGEVRGVHSPLRERAQRAQPGRSPPAPEKSGSQQPADAAHRNQASRHQPRCSARSLRHRENPRWGRWCGRWL